MSSNLIIQYVIQPGPTSPMPRLPNLGNKDIINISYMSRGLDSKRGCYSYSLPNMLVNRLSNAKKGERGRKRRRANKRSRADARLPPLSFITWHYRTCSHAALGLLAEPSRLHFKGVTTKVVDGRQGNRTPIGYVKPLITTSTCFYYSKLNI